MDSLGNKIVLLLFGSVLVFCMTSEGHTLQEAVDELTRVRDSTINLVQCACVHARVRAHNYVCRGIVCVLVRVRDRLRQSSSCLWW